MKIPAHVSSGSSDRQFNRPTRRTKSKQLSRVCAEIIEQRLLLSAGALDPTFGNNGIVLDQESPIGVGLVTAVDNTTGDIIEAGTTNVNDVVPGTPVSLQRYTPSGSLDLTFGNNGTATAPSVSGTPFQTVVQPDGKILVLASFFTYTRTSVTATITLARFTTAGLLDTTFGSGGIVQLNSSPSFLSNRSFFLLPNGDIIVPGSVPTSSTAANTALEELNPSGSPVTTFGTSGIATGAPGLLTGVTFDKNNNLVAVGATPSNSASGFSGLIERFTSIGQLDTSFGTAGSTITPGVQELDTVFVESSGEIEALGGITLYHFTSSGAIDTSFGTAASGFVTLPLSFSPNQTQSIFQPDGKLLLGGGIPTTPGSSAAAVARVNSNGSLDTTFGSSGYAVLPAGYAQLSFAGGLSLQSDGKIILGNSSVSDITSPPGLDFDPTRLNSNGTPDTTFGVNGTSIGRPQFLTADAVTKEPNGNILVAGAVKVGGVTGIYLRTYNTDGSLNNDLVPALGYGAASGYVFVPVPPQLFNEPPVVSRLILDGAGRILVGIVNYGVVRLTPGGVLDSSFGNKGVAAATGMDDFALASNGQIIVTIGFGTLIRFTVNGTPDLTFGSAGIANVPTSSGPVAIQSDGKILVGGSLELPNGFSGDDLSNLAVTRLNTNGTIDTSFGAAGTATANYNKFDPGDNLNNNAQTLSLTVLPNGNILAGGQAQLQDDGGFSGFTAAEFLPTGKLNNAFASGGQIPTTFLSDNFESFTLASVVVQADGSLIFTGGTSNGDQTSFFVIRYTATGEIDSSFGSGGEVTMQFNPTPPGGEGPDDFILGAAAFPNGKLVAVGNAPDPLASSGSGIALVRYDLGLGTVSGTVFNDTNGNGAQTPTESGVVVYADLNNNGILDPGEIQTTTNAAGQYTLSNLPDGPVIIRQLLPADNRQTSPSSNLGQHVTISSTPVTGANFQDTTKIFVSGTVFNDANKNGKQDPTEPGLSGWTIYADLNNDGKFESNEPSKTVGADGTFSFLALNAGSYIFRVIPLAGWTQTFPTNNFGQHVTLSAGGSITNINFGFAQTAVPASISGEVFNDANGNGKLDPGEHGIDSVTVYIDLANAGGFRAGDPLTVTNSQGQYTFTGLAPGNYIVRQTPIGDTQTFPANGFGNHVTLSAGQTVTNANFGDFFPAGSGSISGTVYDDANGNGQQDPGELGISGVTVYIDANNNGIDDPGELSIITNSLGEYSFVQLPAGAYLVRQVLPAGDKQISPALGFGNHVGFAVNQFAMNVNFGDQIPPVPLPDISGVDLDQTVNDPTMINDAIGNLDV